MSTRILTGVPALAAVLLLTHFAPLALLGLIVTAAGVQAYHEYLGLLRRSGLPAGGALPLCAAALLGLGATFGGATVLQAALFAAVLLLLAQSWDAEAGPNADGLKLGGALLLGLLTIPWMMSHLTLLLALEQGRSAALALFVIVTVNDTTAYLTGTLAGRTPLIPSISPNKTVEGGLGGLAGGSLAAALLHFLPGGALAALGLGGALLLGLGCALAAQAGDLLVSKLKRLNYAKDTGALWPGHGGLLDRMDAYLLAVPAAYYLFYWLQL